jgi:hypothetical protein
MRTVRVFASARAACAVKSAPGPPMTLGNVAVAAGLSSAPPRPRGGCSASTASRSQLRRPYVTESHTAPLTGAAALKKMATTKRRGQVRTGRLHVCETWARTPGTTATVARYKNEYGSSLLLPPFLIVGSCCAKIAGNRRRRGRNRCPPLRSGMTPSHGQGRRRR